MDESSDDEAEDEETPKKVCFLDCKCFLNC